MYLTQFGPLKKTKNNCSVRCPFASWHPCHLSAFCSTRPQCVRDWPVPDFVSMCFNSWVWTVSLFFWLTGCMTTLSLFGTGFDGKDSADVRSPARPGAHGGGAREARGCTVNPAPRTCVSSPADGTRRDHTGRDIDCSARDLQGCAARSIFASPCFHSHKDGMEPSEAGGGEGVPYGRFFDGFLKRPSPFAIFFFNNFRRLLPLFLSPTSKRGGCRVPDVWRWVLRPSCICAA
ncbi:hypothetical protein MAPG_00373 [Magnaporthiopsis poae ATCC 64411]|uniref:Uncharacterized protein n=1 Tax=Magnaporthiopsis poae (strain ATCC 64411 / 73-15) TaxID=644358 RepID=A0A0C4DKU3_MAGP6|nr:hypothetical protein MAPG_00373 [Magnaporthiopsis poae ATCC 64411]